jgi:hypothetical protein
MPDSNNFSTPSRRCQTSLMVGWRLLGVLALATIALTAWAATDPWKDKDYKSWTQEDVQKILNESPWVKMVEMGAPWLKGPVHFLTPLPTDCNGRPDMNKNDRTPASWAMGNNESIVIFQVTWQSSRTVRAAKFREAVLCGRADEERGDDLLDREQDDYVITVHAPDMTPFDSMEEEVLIKTSYLMAKKTQKKISPESVQIGRYGRGKSVYLLTYKFPKKFENGEPFISADEKEIEFSSQAGKFNLKTKFQPPKMAAKNGLDL